VAGKDQDFAESLDIDHPAGPAIEHDPPIPKSCIAADAHPIGQTLDVLENWRSRASARDFLDSVTRPYPPASIPSQSVFRSARFPQSQNLGRRPAFSLSAGHME
jgi:hypothetical protein